ncbi:MAG TPA: CHAD domain-containing protein [Terriglobales bacterium]|nr:CHAD domain-containing protein [Terriglobales bacterium]
MRPKGSSESALRSDVSQNQSRVVFDRMSRYTGRLSKKVEPRNVHHFRTNSRRVEALVDHLAPESRNKKKLLRLVSKLRKRAGKLRDLDVQIAYLKNLRLPDGQNHRAQLLELLDDEHARRSRKLAHSFSSETVHELRKRLRHEQKEIRLDGIDPLRVAMSVLPKLGQLPTTEKALHASRIAAKHARYIAELAGDTPHASFFIEELKRAQDAIGEWHDILKLKQKAEKQFGSASDSSLVSMLQNVSRARFRTACNALAFTLATLSRQLRQTRRPTTAAQKAVPEVSEIAAKRRPSSSERSPQTAAVA